MSQLCTGQDDCKVHLVPSLAVPSYQVNDRSPLKIKNVGIWLRYDSRSGTHNMYREYRDLTIAGAVTQCCEFTVCLVCMKCQICSASALTGCGSRISVCVCACVCVRACMCIL